MYTDKQYKMVRVIVAAALMCLCVVGASFPLTYISWHYVMFHMVVSYLLHIFCAKAQHIQLQNEKKRAYIIYIFSILLPPSHSHVTIHTVFGTCYTSYLRSCREARFNLLKHWIIIKMPESNLFLFFRKLFCRNYLQNYKFTKKIFLHKFIMQVY